VRILDDIVACFKTLVLPLTEAKEEWGAVKQALTVLKAFYKKGAKANVFCRHLLLRRLIPVSLQVHTKAIKEHPRLFWVCWR